MKFADPIYGHNISAKFCILPDRLKNFWIMAFEF